MAVRLPDFTSVAGIPTGAENVYPGNIQPNYPREDPEAAAQGLLGRGLQNLGEGAMRIGGEVSQQTNLVNASLAQADLHPKLERIKAAIKAENDPAKIDQLYSQAASEFDNSSKLIPNETYRAQWKAHHAKDLLETQLVGEQRQRAVYSDQFHAGSNQKVKDEIQLASQSDDPAVQERARNNIAALYSSQVEAGVLTHTEAQDAAYKANQAAILGRVQILDATNRPAAAEAYLRQHTEDLPPGVVDAHLPHLEARRKKQRGEDLGTTVATGGRTDFRGPGDYNLTGNDFLASQRAGFKAELDQNPELKKRLAAIVDLENADAGTGVAESLMNRMAMSGGTIASGIGGGGASFYNPVRKGEVDPRIQELTRDPQRLQARMQQIDQALAGSNIVKGHTDQGSKGDPNYEAGGIGVNIAGERFNDWGGLQGVETSRNWRMQQQAQVSKEVGSAEIIPPVAAGTGVGAVRPMGPPTLEDQFANIDAAPGYDDQEKEIAKARAQRIDNQRRAGMRGEIATVKKLMGDDLASLEQTGQAIPELNYDRVRASYGPEVADNWQQERELAQTFYDQTSDFDRLPNYELDRRLEQIRTAGAGQPGFAQRQRLYAQAVKKVNDLEHLRTTSPADAVAKFPEVMAAAQGASLSNPASYRPLVEARVKAMVETDQPLDSQIPITKQEARILYRPIEEALRTGDQKALYYTENGVVHGRLKQLIETVEQGWGGYTPAALAMIMGVGNASQQTQETLHSVLKKLGNAEVPTSGEARSLDQALNTGAASSAVAGLVPSAAAATPAPPVPDPGAIQQLRQNPQQAPAYDAVYGPGAAARVLGTIPPAAPTPTPGVPSTETPPAAPAPERVYRTPDAAAIEMLRRRPLTAPGFEATYGPGSAAQYLPPAPGSSP